MTRYLLDVNVLLALTDQIHVHHEGALRWFHEKGREWATCAITENGFIRILSHPTYPGKPGGVDVALEILKLQRRVAGWQFWTENLSILDMLEPDTLVTPSQITDIYLLGLAAHKRGKLATLDGRINAGAVRGGRKAMELIAI